MPEKKTVSAGLIISLFLVIGFTSYTSTSNPDDFTVRKYVGT